MNIYDKLLSLDNNEITIKKQNIGYEGLSFLYTILRDSYPEVFFNQYQFYLVLQNIGEDWITKKGKLPKRLQKYLKKAFDISIPNELMGIIGDELTNFLVTEEIFVQVTRKIDWKDGEFGDDNSCFWGERFGAKALIELNGGGALKFYLNEEKAGRCLFLPYENGIVFFNIYGRLREFSKGNTKFLLTVIEALFKNIYPAAHVKKVHLSNRGYTSSLLYINDGNGVYVSEVPYYKDSIDLNIEYYCYCCGRSFDEGSYEPGNGFICFDCKKAVTCDSCGTRIWDESSIYHIDNDLICFDCFELNTARCSACSNLYYITDLVPMGEISYICINCLEEHFVQCENCFEYIPKVCAIKENDKYFCDFCHLKT